MRSILSVGFCLAALTVLWGCQDGLQDPVQAPVDAASPSGDAALSHPGNGRAMVPHNFVAPLEGGQEVPAVDTRARGLATFQLSRNGEEVRFRLNVANIENVLMAHIHVGPRGENGPVVVWLYPDMPPPQLIEGRFDGVLNSSTFTADALVGDLEGEPLSALIDEMTAGNTYVNVHTEQNPGGEIRGQIQVAGPR